MLERKIKEFRLEFEPRLNKFFDSKILKASTMSFEMQHNLSQIVRVSTLKQAKRIRPILAYYGYLVAGGDKSKNLELIYNLGIGLEIFHSSALIWDDIIDQGIERRGEPTIEAHYQKYFTRSLGTVSLAKHNAMSSSLLAGGLAMSIADSAISDLPGNLREYFFDMAFELFGGQIDDCFGVGLSDFEDLSEQKILTMLQTKSGNYSIQKPIIMGMILADPEKSLENLSKNTEIQKMTEITEKIGLIFQLTDDILGIFGHEDVTGKSNISDIIEGKKTLLIYRTFQASSPVEKLRMRKVLGEQNYNLEEIRWLKNHVTKLGVLDNLKKECQSLNNLVQTELKQNFDLKNKGIEFISQFSYYLLNRSK